MRVQSRSEQGSDSSAGERRRRFSTTPPSLVLEASCSAPREARPEWRGPGQGGLAGRRPALRQRDHQELPLFATFRTATWERWWNAFDALCPSQTRNNNRIKTWNVIHQLWHFPPPPAPLLTEWAVSHRTSDLLDTFVNLQTLILMQIQWSRRLSFQNKSSELFPLNFLGSFLSINTDFQFVCHWFKTSKSN